MPRLGHIFGTARRLGRKTGRLTAVDSERWMPSDGTPVAPPAAAEPLEAGPVQPGDEVRNELRALLAADETRLGQVYRCLDEGLDAGAIAEKFGVSYPSFVWNYNRLIKALLDGNLPTAPTVALAAARKFRTILKNTSLSGQARAYLEANLDELDRRANDTDRREEEAQRAQAQTQEAEARNEIGIYVYALPHYLRYPFELESRRTLLKVGRSDSDVIERFRNQTRTTALPEEPILLRIYRTPGQATAPMETRFHRLLEAADHSRSVARSAGREWFLTSTRFLDEIANALGLAVDVVNDNDVVEDS